MRIRVIAERRPSFETTLAQFAIDHELDARETAKIAIMLCNRLDYVGGGGAMPYFTIKRAVNRKRAPRGDCDHCRAEPAPGWIITANNGAPATVPCPVCNSDERPFSGPGVE
jgi:hypothetical protein